MRALPTAVSLPGQITDNSEVITESTHFLLFFVYPDKMDEHVTRHVQEWTDVSFLEPDSNTSLPMKLPFQSANNIRTMH